MKFVKCTEAGSSKPIWINLALVRTMFVGGTGTALTFQLEGAMESGHRVVVKETPDTILGKAIG